MQITSYLNSAIRQINNKKLISGLNIIGMGAAIAVALMIALFVRQQSGFDAYHEKADQIYRLNWQNIETGARFATFFNPISPVMQADLPDTIEMVARINMREHMIRVDGENMLATLSPVDPAFFDMFAFDVIAGDVKATIADKNAVVITQSAAVKLFGPNDAVGQVISVDAAHDYRVGAIVSDNPANSHLTANIFMHVDNILTLTGNADFWQNAFSDQFYHYVMLKEGVDPLVAEDQMLDVIVNKYHERARDFVIVKAQALADVHFSTELQNEMPVRDEMTGLVKPPRQKSDLYIFATVALLTVAIATFNFMNLQVAVVANRVAEVGVRKVLGADKRDIVIQFVLEAIVLAAGALFVAIVLAEILLPVFGALAGAALPSSLVFDPVIIFAALAGGILIAFLGGVYPAYLASKQLPNTAIKGEISKGAGGKRLRSILILVQFVFAIGLIIASGIVSSQVNFALGKPLGFDGRDVTVVQLPPSKRSDYSALRQQLQADPSVVSVSAGNIVPTQDLSDGFSFQIQGRPDSFSLSTRAVIAETEYFETLGMEMVAGRGFSEEYTSDRMPPFGPENANASGAIILNETAVKRAGFSSNEEALGAVLTSGFNYRGTQYHFEYTVVGIVKDAHYRSIRTEISPISFTLRNRMNSLIVKSAPGKRTDVENLINQVWGQHTPDYPVMQFELQEVYNQFYAGEERTFALFLGLTGLALLIACMGLYGLTVYTMERRTKEVGIRKVLGASLASLMRLLTWDYMKLVLAANVVAWPAAYYIMQSWLNNFSYRTDITIFIFLGAGLTAMVIAFATVASKTYQIVRMSPVRALRYE